MTQNEVNNLVSNEINNPVVQPIPKLKLNDFTEESPDLWLKIAEILFPPFAVETEIQKFAYFL